MNPCAKCGRTGGTLYTGGCSLCIPGFPIPQPDKGREGTGRCPTCGSDDPPFMPGGYSEDYGSWTPCPDPFHQGETEMSEDKTKVERVRRVQLWECPTEGCHAITAKEAPNDNTCWDCGIDPANAEGDGWLPRTAYLPTPDQVVVVLDREAAQAIRLTCEFEPPSGVEATARARGHDAFRSALEEKPDAG